MKRAILISLFVASLLCCAPLLAALALTQGQQTVRVLTVPVPGGRGLLLITTPCSDTRAGSIGLWTARYNVGGVHVIPLRSWAERREFFGNGILNRLVMRVATMRRC